jgi:hypothetical protein
MGMRELFFLTRGGGGEREEVGKATRKEREKDTEMQKGHMNRKRKLFCLSSLSGDVLVAM